MDQQESIERLSARISGRVQGVGYRHFTRMRAQELDLDGWVRNERDESVSLVAEGPRYRLEALIQQLRSGPPGARVADVSIQWSKATGEFTGFTVRH